MDPTRGHAWTPCGKGVPAGSSYSSAGAAPCGERVRPERWSPASAAGSPAGPALQPAPARQGRLWAPRASPPHPAPRSSHAPWLCLCAGPRQRVWSLQKAASVDVNVPGGKAGRSLGTSPGSGCGGTQGPGCSRVGSQPRTPVSTSFPEFRWVLHCSVEAIPDKRGLAKVD